MSEFEHWMYLLKTVSIVVNLFLCNVSEDKVFVYNFIHAYVMLFSMLRSSNIFIDKILSALFDRAFSRY